MESPLFTAKRYSGRRYAGDRLQAEEIAPRRLPASGARTGAGARTRNGHFAVAADLADPSDGMLDVKQRAAARRTSVRTLSSGRPSPFRLEIVCAVPARTRHS